MRVTGDLMVARSCGVVGDLAGIAPFRSGHPAIGI